MVEEYADAPFCLGDNGCRPGALPRPGLFARAEEQRVPVLGGSDPLPVPAHVTRPGSYGFVLDAWHPEARPGQAIVRRIQKMQQSPPAFGTLSSFPGLLRSQIELRWRSRANGQLAS
jgi:hypothetical protein